MIQLSFGKCSIWFSKGPEVQAFCSFANYCTASDLAVVQPPIQFMQLQNKVIQRQLQQSCNLRVNSFSRRFSRNATRFRCHAASEAAPWCQIRQSSTSSSTSLLSQIQRSCRVDSATIQAQIQTSFSLNFNNHTCQMQQTCSLRFSEDAAPDLIVIQPQI